MKSSCSNFQIDRASAGNVKLTKNEITADPEEEDDFGYTTSEYLKPLNKLERETLVGQYFTKIYLIDF